MNDPISQILKARSDLAALAVRASLLKLRFKAGFRPDQPRVPAGDPEGGQWTGSGSDGGQGSRPGGVADTSRLGERVVRDGTGEKPWTRFVESRRSDGFLALTTVHNRDGSTILSTPLGIGGERNLVTLKNETQVTFENIGDTQKIFDAKGKLISEAVWTPNAPEAQPIIQQVFLARERDGRPRMLEFGPGGGGGSGGGSGRGLGIGAAAITLFNWLAGREEPGEKTVLAFNARAYRRKEGVPLDYLGTRTREEIESICERFPLVQALTQKAKLEFRTNTFSNQAVRGTAIHAAVKRDIDNLKDPNLRSEISLLKTQQETEVRYGIKDSIRIDVFERFRNDSVCVYDIKTSRSQLTLARTREIADNIRAVFSAIDHIFVIEVRTDD